MNSIPFDDKKELFRLIVNKQLDWDRYSSYDSRWNRISKFLSQLKNALIPYPVKPDKEFAKTKMLESINGMILTLIYFPAHILSTGKVAFEYRNEMDRHNDDFSYHFRRVFDLPEDQIFS